ncbi:MAG: CapA family protein [Clostridia bacterium]|nr:CapA family protein [Clostridia bacterium]
MKRKRRGVSFGTTVMLVLLAVTLGGSVFVVLRLAGNGSIDLARVAGALQMEKGDQKIEDIRIQQDSAAQPGGPGEASQAAAAVPQPTQTPASAVPSGGKGAETQRAVLTFGGTTAIETEVRRSCYFSDTKKYDFTDMFQPLREAFQADWSCVFLENILSDDYKVNASIVPASAAELMSSAGIKAAFGGFSGIYDKGQAGLESTRRALESQGILTPGLEANGELTVLNGIRFYIGAYTGTISASSRKSMAKNGDDAAVPAADPAAIQQDIQNARAGGAEAVIILIHWGRDGKNVDKSQRQMAQQIAEAGADVIIGSGSRIPQAAEMISVTGTDGRPHQTLCVYSLGTLLSGNRNNAKRLGSYLLHVTFDKGPDGAALTGMSYTPVYIWRYKQDGKFNYRCVPVNGKAPDGMDSEQMKTMEKAGNAVADVLTGSPLTVR